MGRGGGWRHRNWAYATGLPGWQRATGVAPLGRQQELEALQEQSAGLERVLNDLKARIADLETPVDKG